MSDKKAAKDDELRAIAPAAEGTEAATAEGAESEGGKKSKKKLIIILLIALLVLGGAGGGAAYFFILKKKPAVTAPKLDKQGKPIALNPDGTPVASVFLEIPNMLVNLSSMDGQTRYLRLSVQLELANELDKKAVEAVLPRVVDQFQTYLRELRVKDLRGSAGIYRLQTELLSRVNAAAAPIEVKNVLFQEILIQ